MQSAGNGHGLRVHTCGDRFSLRRTFEACDGDAQQRSEVSRQPARSPGGPTCAGRARPAGRGATAMIAVLENWTGGIVVITGTLLLQVATQMLLLRVLVGHPAIGRLSAWPLLRSFVVPALATVCLIFGHLAQVLLWALFYLALEQFGGFADAAYFSLASYTTIGPEDLELSRNHRVLGALEAGVGVLMFGWSTAILVTLVDRTHGPGRQDIR